MTTYYVSFLHGEKTIKLHIPCSWNVGRMKEIILLYHPESPSIRSQVLHYNDQKLENSEELSAVFGPEIRPEVKLTLVNVPEPDESMTGFRSDLFKTREKEYLKKYTIAKQLLLDYHHKPQDGYMIPFESTVNSLPIMHPEAVKRVRFFSVNEKPRKIRLRKIPISMFFDHLTMIRWSVFTLVAVTYLEARIPPIYYMFILICYLINIRAKIEAFREKELRKLPRDYLMKILPERFNAGREGQEGDSKGIVVVVYETARAFLFSLLPWFDITAYANERNRAI